MHTTYPIVTAEQMRRMDRCTIDEIGIPALVLMENAGRAVAEEALRLHPHGQGHWAVLVGKGNNGGDGLVAARHLAAMGHDVTIIYAVRPEELGGDAAVERDIAQRLGLPGLVYGEAPVPWDSCSGIIDALLGTGTSGPPREPYGALIREANASGKPIVAADLPSGVHADTGEAFEPHIRAARTVALAFLKRGLTQQPAKAACGTVAVRDIGIPAVLASRAGVSAFRLTEAALRDRLGIDPQAARAENAHKGNYGHVLVAAGSGTMSGAGLLCAKAALRAGCGLVTWALPAALAPSVIGHLPEAMLAPMPDDGTGEWQPAAVRALLKAAAGCGALAAGPGVGRFAGETAWLEALWRTSLPLVLDADALNMLADAMHGQHASAFSAAVWPRREAPAVITPHPGEMARLTGKPIAEVQRDRIGTALRYAAQWGVTVVLKGADTVIASPEGTAFVNANGNPGMATAGAGDVLTGVIAAQLAAGWQALPAAAYGAYLHGAAGDRAAAARSRTASLIAGDIIEFL